VRTINAAGLTLVKKWEGILDGDPSTVNLDPYLDPVGIWTIGWGHAITDTHGRFFRGASAGPRVRALYPDGITMAQAEELLRADLLDASRDVSALVAVPLSENQFSALVSFDFNTGALRGSSLRKLLNAGDYIGAAAQFGRWTKGRVDDKLVVLPGLVSRREDERRLFIEA
jgi:lysozyme